MIEDREREAAKLRWKIALRKRTLAEALEELKRAADERTSVVHYMRKYPWQLLAAGFVLGAWLGRHQGEEK